MDSDFKWIVLLVIAYMFAAVAEQYIDAQREIARLHAGCADAPQTRMESKP